MSQANVLLPADRAFVIQLQVNSEESERGEYTMTRDEIGARDVFVAFRTLVDSSNPTDIEAANTIQDQIQVQQSSTGTFEIPNWIRSPG